MSSRSGSSSTRKEEERPRFFDSIAKNRCWAKAETVPGRHPDRWRKDAAGNIVCKRFCNCHGCLCFEYDHIIPYSKGGESVAENCQILQTRVNRFKSDNEEIRRLISSKWQSMEMLFGQEINVVAELLQKFLAHTSPKIDWLPASCRMVKAPYTSKT